MWQARNPQNYITQQNEANEHGGSPLTPFRHPNSEFWTPIGVRKTETLGYAYPETQSWNFATTPQLYQRSLRERVETLYGGRIVKTYDLYVTDRLNALDERLGDLENRIALLGVANQP
jgi:tyrosinase